MSPRYVLFGSGGHAKVVLEALRAADREAQVALVDDDPAALGRSLLDLTVSGSRAWLEPQVRAFEIVPAIGNNAARDEVLRWVASLSGRPASVAHPSAVLSPSASIGAGCFAAPGAIVNAEARLDDGGIVNTGASVDHDCRIGRAVHVGPGARLCGGVRVGARTLIGVGAVVIPGITIGADVVVGAGAVVVRDVPDGARVHGCPARPSGAPRR